MKPGAARGHCASVVAAQMLASVIVLEAEELPRLTRTATTAPPDRGPAQTLWGKRDTNIGRARTTSRDSE